jgi:DNA-directed RNA polymerase specialized sigma24 family protein
VNVIDALEAAPPPPLRLWRTWTRAEPVLAGLDYRELRRVLLDETPPVDYERRDDLLAALIRLSRDDERAGEVLVVCLLPGIKAKLRRHSHGVDRDEAAQVMVEALWRRIRRYPLDRRPRKIALNLLLDTAHDFIDTRDRDNAWAGRHQLTGDDANLDAEPPDPGDSPALMWHQAIGAGVLTARDVTLIDGTRLRGLPLGDTAGLVGISHDAAKKARRRSEVRFARWWAPDDRRHAA